MEKERKEKGSSILVVNLLHLLKILILYTSFLISMHGLIVKLPLKSHVIIPVLGLSYCHIISDLDALSGPFDVWLILDNLSM